MSLLKFFKKELNKTNQTFQSSQGRVIKELSLTNLKNNEKELIINLYNSLLLLNNQELQKTILNYILFLLLELPITPVENPITTGEFIAHSKNKLQSSRCRSLWSHDSVLWYDLDNDTKIHSIYRWIYKNIFRSSENTPNFITSRMMPYVSFPYTKSIK